MTRIFLLLTIICLLPGCTALHKSHPTAVYDFGIQTPPSSQPSAQPAQLRKHSLLVADTTAPVWLDSKAIHYRLLYHNPTQSYTYANNRWIATPAALFTQQLRNRIAASTQEQVIKDNSIATADHVLHTELEEFSQVFDTATDSRIVVGLRASLIERNSRKLLAQKDFNITAKTPSADAAGAVSALGAASNQLLNELVNWLAATLPHD
ncbi:ABC-type transport auxiliary lipoprotein family protein [Nitrosomonas oligotropha]|uniref:Cholesterol transport system auxiliary component n=1 Tax=Nitrosomonas oligotropha TaxID=42354 RepID=A0A1H8R796_9PROT|nr:ABC-type transport auxiliary lipoprotein family protein [Nitrosomonas oligotropha]SDW83562.1 cholesterol transport system auxiliary component [Nitrosomonas oligotropha]SEO62004.1 cholesterol transport system auxiliary component [Nitrosomonas oligotropha]